MTSNWLFHMQADDLLAALPATLAANIRMWEASEMTLEQIAIQIAAWPATDNLKGHRTPAHGLWPALRHEVWLLICTDEPKYQGVRAELGKESKVAGTVALSLISSAVGVHISVDAGMATPFVALLLLALLRTSKEAWCARQCPLPAHFAVQPIQRDESMRSDCSNDRRSTAVVLDLASDVQRPASKATN